MTISQTPTWDEATLVSPPAIIFGWVAQKSLVRGLLFGAVAGRPPRWWDNLSIQSSVAGPESQHGERQGSR